MWTTFYRKSITQTRKLNPVGNFKRDYVNRNNWYTHPLRIYAFAIDGSNSIALFASATASGQIIVLYKYDSTYIKNLEEKNRACLT